MPLSCIYHKTFPMRVMEDEEIDKWVATGEWFRHPNDVKEKEYEKPIRQQPRKRRKHDEHPSGSDGS